MKTAAIRMVCRLLVVSMALLPFQTIHAAMIGTDQVVAAATAQAERASVLDTVSRPDVASQLQALGVDPNVAKARAAAMTEDEIRTLAGKLDSLPVGAGSPWVAFAAAILILIFLLYDSKQ